MSSDHPSDATQAMPVAATADKDIVVLAEFSREAADQPQPRHRVARRRVLLPTLLFGATCVSTFIAGACQWFPARYLDLGRDLMPLRQTILTHWQDGLVYMTALLAILVFHEMGHFLATVWYRVPASFPFFVPVPFTPIGTMGAVIGMEGTRANRKELFDIGLAGPLAGLCIAIPAMWFGVRHLQLTDEVLGPYAAELPLLVQWVLAREHPPGYVAGEPIWVANWNPLFAAGWVGCLVTGLNMLPVSQLDGGHVVHTVFGRRGRWIARGFMVFWMAYMVFTASYTTGLMFMLALLVGPDHPPTRDDNMRLGWFRTALGLASLSIPFLCLHPRILRVVP